MKILSKAVLMSGILVAATSAHAQWQWNFLLGASAGYADRSGDLALSFSTAAPDTVIYEAVRGHDDSGFIWGVLGGLQAHCNNWLFGGELHVDWHDFDKARSQIWTVENEAVGVTSRFDRGTVVALSARAGYQMAPYLMPYIRLGVETSNDELMTTFSAPGEPSLALVGDKRSYRFLGGVGIEVPVPSLQGLSIRAEYNYHGKGRAVNAGGLDSDSDFLNVGYKPKTHSGKASLVYNFI